MPVRRALIVQDECCKIVDIERIELCFVNWKCRLNDEWNMDYEKWNIFPILMVSYPFFLNIWGSVITSGLVSLKCVA